MRRRTVGGIGGMGWLIAVGWRGRYSTKPRHRSFYLDCCFVERTGLRVLEEEKVDDRNLYRVEGVLRYISPVQRADDFLLILLP